MPIVWGITASPLLAGGMNEWRQGVSAVLIIIYTPAADVDTH